ncbi:MAG: DUF4097 family beta strand repeat-containing protein [Rhodothermales bacterium]
MLHRAVTLLVVSITLLAFSPVRAEETTDITDTVKEVFKVRPGGTLVVDIDHGNISVRTDRGDEVRIELVRRVSSTSADEAKRLLERNAYSFEQRGNDVEIRSRLDGDGSFWSRRGRDRLRVSLEVVVPEEYSVDFTTGAGNVTLGDIGGQVEGRTGAGNLKLGAVHGEVHVSSGSGNIDIRGARGAARISTAAGNVHIENLAESVEVRTGAGNITANLTEQPASESSLETGAGNVTVYVGSRVGANVDATAALGAASTDFPLSVEGKWMSKSFAGDINGGGPAIRMKAGVGNVSLKRLP